MEGLKSEPAQRAAPLNPFRVNPELPLVAILRVDGDRADKVPGRDVPEIENGEIHYRWAEVLQKERFYAPRANRAYHLLYGVRLASFAETLLPEGNEGLRARLYVVAEEMRNRRFIDWPDDAAPAIQAALASCRIAVRRDFGKRWGTLAREVERRAHQAELARQNPRPEESLDSEEIADEYFDDPIREILRSPFDNS